MHIPDYTKHVCNRYIKFNTHTERNPEILDHGVSP